MRIFRLLFFSFIFFALLITGISLFFPSHVRISRATTIAAPPDSIYVQLADAANWFAWYPGLDSAKLVTGNDGRASGVTMDVVSSDGSATASRKQLLIRDRKPGEVTTGYLAPGRSEVNSGWTVFPDSNLPNATTVQWYMDFHMRWYPWEKFASLLFEKNYGPLMELGLTRLKRHLEGNRSSP